MKYQKTIFNRVDVRMLTEKFGSPLYVYDEATLRQRCREMKNLIKYPHFQVNYSAKANTNTALLSIIREEGLHVDAMTPGEMFLEMKAGFPPDCITFIGNNVSAADFRFAREHGIYISVDSLSQLKTLGECWPGGDVSLRINTGVGAGHHEKVITGGDGAKFGIVPEDIPEALRIADEFGLKVTGVNHHIGSQFMDTDDYVFGASRLLELAKQIPALEIVDIGGGFGIPYERAFPERLNLQELGDKLDVLLEEWTAQTGKEITLRIEPGRYIVAECGVILGEVTAVKKNHGIWFVGCNVGFNTLIRPAMYDSYHEIGIVPQEERPYAEYTEPVYLVGPICESGDKLTHDRLLPICREGDGVIVYDAGAYGFTMASNYNSQPLPAEVLLCESGEIRLIRRAQTLEDLWQTQCL